MAIDRGELDRHLQDYCETTGSTSNRFVCPITLHKCDESELIDGHILNEALRQASRRTVIQYKEVDNFYGTRVEPSMIAFLNMLNNDGSRLPKYCRPKFLVFDDGSRVKAFPVGRRAANEVPLRFARVRVTEDGQPAIFAEIAKDDPRLSRPFLVECEFRSPPSHWTAAMLKAGHLCLFDMVGYRAVFCPFGEVVRHTLATYYAEGGQQNPDLHFAEFKNAVKVLAVHKQEGDGRLHPYAFDSIEDREVLLHQSVNGCTFAATCIFKINDLTATVTLPEASTGSDAGRVWSLYSQFMENPVGFPQEMHRARFEGDRWTFEMSPTNIRVVAQIPI